MCSAASAVAKVLHIRDLLVLADYWPIGPDYWFFLHFQYQKHHKRRVSSLETPPHSPISYLVAAWP